MKRAKIVYILPALGLGGVEIGLRKAYPKLTLRFELEIFTVDKAVKKLQPIPSQSLNWVAFFRIFLARKDVVIVTSLWRAHLVGLALRALGGAWIPFFHNPGYGHLLDRNVCRIASMLSTFRFFDCEESRTAFLGKSSEKQSAIVPFVFWDEESPPGLRMSAERDLDLLFVGRYARVKRLDLCIALGKMCIEICPDFHIGFVGQGAQVSDIDSFEADFPDNVINFGFLEPPKVREAFRRSRMVLCLSDHEGMAMAVVEGIQEGCVPVVRMVGEISKYVDKSSAIICDRDLNLRSLASHIKEIRLDTSALKSMNRKALVNLKSYPDYSDAFIAGLEGFFSND